MSNLQKHLDDKENQLARIEATLKALQEQLTLAQQELRVERQLQEAQKTIKKEFDDQKKVFAKILKDACSCYPQEAIADMLEDIKEIADDVSENYDSYSNSDRFLNLETSESEDTPPESQKILLETRGGGDVTSDTQIMLLETMPAADDDQTTLTTGNISQILENLGDDVISKLQVLFGVSGRIKTRGNIYKALADKSISRKSLENYIKMLGGLGLPPSEENNGHSHTIVTVG